MQNCKTCGKKVHNELNDQCDDCIALDVGHDDIFHVSQPSLEDIKRAYNIK